MGGGGCRCSTTNTTTTTANLLLLLMVDDGVELIQPVLNPLQRPGKLRADGALLLLGSGVGVGLG